MDQAILIKGLSHTYQIDTPFEAQAIYDINVTIPEQKITAIIGHTGSGKSTLIQHLNGLLKPTSGSVQINDYVLTKDAQHTSLKALRQQVGVVFQFPESQLFGDTVLEDVMFGPLNFEKSNEEAKEIAKSMLELVQIDPDLYDRSPFELSGGQMRRVAIAGIMALQPKVLVLDEPTAGLDPQGHHSMMEMFQRIQQEQQLTIVLVTHQMDDVLKYADKVVVLEAGKVIRQGSVEEIFQDAKWLQAKQLDVPESVRFLRELGLETFNALPKDADEVVELLMNLKADDDDV